MNPFTSYRLRISFFACSRLRPRCGGSNGQHTFLLHPALVSNSLSDVVVSTWNLFCTLLSRGEVVYDHDDDHVIVRQLVVVAIFCNTISMGCLPVGVHMA